ncbi:uncharacterized protein LOC130363185 [Hyla sarda]|uniref:uncharacterized protein LOC130363185 n=1 Tax=Hyla sarda TaxID=327740 RepID=UPI0024C22FD5|nr:uncharacterized protein LOC130363185 [Hyla sarda]
MFCRIITWDNAQKIRLETRLRSYNSRTATGNAVFLNKPTREHRYTDVLCRLFLRGSKESNPSVCPRTKEKEKEIQKEKKLKNHNPARTQRNRSSRRSHKETRSLSGTCWETVRRSRAAETFRSDGDIPGTRRQRWTATARAAVMSGDGPERRGQYLRIGGDLLNTDSRAAATFLQTSIGGCVWHTTPKDWHEETLNHPHLVSQGICLAREGTQRRVGSTPRPYPNYRTKC